MLTRGVGGIVDGLEKVGGPGVTGGKKELIL